MTIEQVSEEEFDYHLLFQPPENPPPEPDWFLSELIRVPIWITTLA
jgi:hypothetical protein